MAKLVVRLLPGKLVVWSNTVDAPVSGVMNAEELVAHLVEHEQVSYTEALAVVEAANRDGTSDPAQPLSELLATNRAGPSEETLDVEGIVARYS